MREVGTPDLAGLAAAFADVLHRAGVAVAPDRAGRWAAAIRLARPAATDELYCLGRVTLTLDPHEIAIYDAAFASVFRGLTDVADRRGDPNASPIPQVDAARDRAPADMRALEARRGGAPRAMPTETTGESDDDDSTARPTARPAPATHGEVLRRRDFADCTIEELAHLRRIIAAMQVAPPMRASRRHRRHHLGRAVDRRDRKSTRLNSSH